MTREEREAAIAYIKSYRKLDENLHNTALKDSISYYATAKCLKYWDMAIQALSQEPCRVKNELNVELNELKPCTDAVSREAVIEILENYGCTNREGLIFKDIRALPSVTQKSEKWIPFSERLPKPFEHCLITTIDGEVIYHYDDGHYSKYKAWMPLPKPYEPQESEDKE